jgi:GR25 family glycosyltransferase involved in LPS biosynthesis
MLQGDDGLSLNEMHDRVRSLKKDGLGELGCLLAHLKAMDYTTSNGIDFILEDSARIAPSTAETLIAGAKALRAGTADMVYAGFLGSEANLVCNRRADMCHRWPTRDVIH